MSSVFIDGGGGGDGGFDHGHDHGHDHGDHADHSDHGHDGGHQPSQTPIWSQALQGLKITDLINNIRITPNHLLLFMFCGFTGWLGVIYWIRHHEPLANHVLGSGAAYTANAYADRQLINAAREALPVKTTSGSGLVYTPGITNAMSAYPNYNQAAAQPAPAVAAPDTTPAGFRVRFSPYRQNLAIRSGSNAAPASAISNGMSGQLGAPPESNLGNGLRTFGRRAAPAGPAYASAAMPGQGSPGLNNMPVQMAAPPAGWSLANSGFSSDSAHYDAQFGVPAGGSSMSGNFPQPGPPAGPSFAPGVNGGITGSAPNLGVYTIPANERTGRPKVYTNR